MPGLDHDGEPALMDTRVSLVTTTVASTVSVMMRGNLVQHLTDEHGPAPSTEQRFLRQLYRTFQE